LRLEIATIIIFIKGLIPNPIIKCAFVISTEGPRNTRFCHFDRRATQYTLLSFRPKGHEVHAFVISTEGPRSTRFCHFDRRATKWPEVEKSVKKIDFSTGSK